MDFALTRNYILRVFDCYYTIVRHWVFSGVNIYTSYNSCRSSMNAEEGINLKFSVRLGKTPPETLEMLQKVYKYSTYVFKWNKKFIMGYYKLKDDTMIGRPSTGGTKINIEPLKQLVRGDRQLIHWMTAYQWDIKILVLGRLSPGFSLCLKIYWIG